MRLDRSGFYDWNYPQNVLLAEDLFPDYGYDEEYDPDENPDPSTGAERYESRQQNNFLDDGYDEELAEPSHSIGSDNEGHIDAEATAAGGHEAGEPVNPAAALEPFPPFPFQFDEAFFERYNGGRNDKEAAATLTRDYEVRVPAGVFHRRADRGHEGTESAREFSRRAASYSPLSDDRDQPGDDDENPDPDMGAQGHEYGPVGVDSDSSSDGIDYGIANEPAVHPDNATPTTEVIIMKKTSSLKASNPRNKESL